ncbi:MAG: hypothetical protein WC623_24175 [Pedobacter sp.]|uniref:hypothetical protein n=1 Tax=Pedobacter sp. TaxID=1411316 RepID=UPI0035612C58
MKRILRVTKNKIKIGADTTDHLTEIEAQAYIDDEYGKINEGLSSLGYKVPLTINSTTIKIIEQNWAAYKIYVSLFPTNNPDGLPEAVNEWRKEAEKLWEKIESRQITFDTATKQGNITSSLPLYETPKPVFNKVGVSGIGDGEIEV